MFDVDRQTAVRELLLDRARADGRVTGAAVTGFAARGTADRWSDVDLFLGVDDTVEVADVLADWTVLAEEGLGAVPSGSVRIGRWDLRDPSGRDR